LAALSMQGRENVSAFIAGFAGEYVRRPLAAIIRSEPAAPVGQNVADPLRP